MHKHPALLLLLAAAPVLWAQERPAEPLVNRPLAAANLQGSLQQLKAAREGLDADRQAAERLRTERTPYSDENSRLRQRLEEALAKLNARKTPAAAKNPAANGGAPFQPGAEKSSTEQTAKAAKDTPPAQPLPLNPLALAHSLYQARNFEGSLQAYRMIDQKGMKAEDRLPIQYMIATCLKRLGKLEEATALYREIGNSKGDEHVAVCAQWQLSTLRWQRELQNDLNDIRQRRQALERSP